jgi:hypothetical protein
VPEFPAEATTGTPADVAAAIASDMYEGNDAVPSGPLSDMLMTSAPRSNAA